VQEADTFFNFLNEDVGSGEPFGSEDEDLSKLGYRNIGHGVCVSDEALRNGRENARSNTTSIVPKSSPSRDAG
jgi:hypothetical protein